jgi:parvin
MAFANKHLTGTGLVVSNLALQFHDGVYFIILIGSLGDFFVPLYNYHLTPTTSKMKVGGRWF